LDKLAICPDDGVHDFKLSGCPKDT